MSNYGWIIDWGNPNIGLEDEKDTVGPRDISPQLEAQLNNNEGEAFQLYDDDDELYYYGRIVGDYEGFEPLDDWGTPNAGCSYIKYKDDTGNWVMF